MVKAANEIEIGATSMQVSFGHLKNYIQYPATRQSPTAPCSTMMDVPAEDRDLLVKMIPEENYRNAEDVVRALMAKV